MDFPKRGEIWLVSLEPVVGREIGKTRPALIISNEQNNQYADTITVLPVTSKTGKIYPFETFLPKGKCNIPADSKVKSNQVRTIDKKRLVRLLGVIPQEILTQVEQSLLIHLDIYPEK